MYPSQTSLIPVTVTLAQFVNDHGLAAFSKWFDLWYLGVPFKYATEPVVPVLLASLYRLTGLSFFSLAVYTVFVSLLIGSLGWSIFAYTLTKNKKIFLISFVFFVITPWKYLSAFAISDVSAVLARALLPYALCSYWGLCDKGNTGDRGDIFVGKTVAVITTATLLLTSISILPIFVVGILSIVAAKSQPKYKYQSIKRYIRVLSLVSCVSLVLVTFWYTPEYWITIILNPSIGGISGIKVIGRIFDLVKASFPVGLAIFTVHISRKIKSKLMVFSLLWTATFMFLTFFRFVSDYDFFLDWSSWMGEIEVGVILLTISLSVVSHQFSVKRFASFLLLLLIPLTCTLFVYSALGKPILIENDYPLGISEMGEIGESTNNYKRIFLSGSSVFWESNVPQVRGGNDKAAIHPYWDIAAYEIREGSDPDLTQYWLKVLGVSEVLVHTDDSSEYYHDFRHLDKWEKVGTKTKDSKGDVYYQIDNSHTVVEVDWTKLQSVSTPKDGKDKEALNNYLASVINPELGYVLIKNLSGYKIKGFNLPKSVLVKIAYYPKWKAYDENGGKITIVKDPLGNITIPDTSGAKEISLVYE